MAAKIKMPVKKLFLTIFLVFMTTVVHGLDFPHVPSNPILPDIGCLSCHDLHGSAGSLLKASVPNPDMGGDNTEANNLCWSCHTGPSLAPYRVPHSSDQIGDQYGTWNIECKDCHNPHNQPQIQTFGTEAFLATGTLTSVTQSANSTLTDTSAAWTVDEHAGRVVFPDVNARDRRGIPIGDLSYRIESNTATTLTLDGVINTGYIAAGDTYGIVYGKVIRNEIQAPADSSWKQVKFFSNMGANSFADDDATLDGVCQVCHTKTGHFRNDGTGPDQMHTNADRGDLTGTAGENCTEKCHLHIGGFGHGKGNTDVTLCIECHGHEEGTIYDPDGTFPYYPNGSTLTSRGFGSVIPHTTHTESWHTDGANWETTKPAGAGDDDLRGPGIYCSWCHDTENMPTFRIDGAYAADDINSDGVVSLDETSVCNDCHSPGGDYNGVESVDGSVGAKNNWHSEGIYDADYNFKPGKEKWCAGCHDKDPSHIVIAERGIDITAPKIVGDEEADSRYGVGWGFYKTGHGTPSTTTIPASGGIKNGPGLSCTYCHQSIRTHIDGDHRTFDCSDGCDSAEYSASYRMRKFSGSEPMQMPRLEDGGIDPTDFDLCLRSGCHGDAQDSFIDSENMETNFRNETTNLHQYHLNFYSAVYTSADWSTAGDYLTLGGGVYNNRLTCISCHNPHGTQNHTMIRTGELTSRPPINIYYWDSSINLPSYIIPPNPDNITLGASDKSILDADSIAAYCGSACHSSGIWHVDRTPFQNTNLAPILKWSEYSDYQADGAAPDVAPAGTVFTFMVQYLDYGNDAPNDVFLWVDADDNGTYEDIASEKFTMSPIDVTPVYVAGVHYSTTVTLGKAGDNIIKYKFTASDIHGAATGEPTGDSTLQILNAAPTLDWTQEDERYSSDGVHSDNGANGGTYQFRIKYTDVDGSDGCPTSGSSDIQVWIDLNDANGYEAGEKFNMLQVDGDADCTDGKLYYYDAVLTDTGTHNYKFYASDGSDDAYGTPATTDSSITVAADGNTVPVLSWVSESCFVDGVKPPNGANGANGTDFEFKIKYTDEDNQCPTGGGSADIQVWIDEDKNSTYDAGEKHNLSPVDGDADCTTSGGGKLYNVTGLTLATNTDMPFEFHASDGIATDNAIGAPVTTGGAVDVYSAKTVKSSGGDYTSIQGAISALAGNTTLLVDPGSYGAVSFQHDADHNWTIISICGADQTTITGGTADAVHIANGLNTVIDGFTMTGTTESDEHGITTNGGSLTLKNSKLHSNTGSGAYLQTDVTLENVEIYNNSSRGIYTNGGTHNFTDLIVRNNTGNGAGILWQNLSAPATLTNVTIKDNSSTGAGGGMYINGAANTINITDCTITGNVAGGTNVGGAGYVNAGTVNLTNCVIADNSAPGVGGAFRMSGGTLTLNNSTIADNSSPTDGGAIYTSSATVSITNSILWNNVSGEGDGHAVYSTGTGSVAIIDSVVQNDWDDDYIDRPFMDGNMSMFSASGFLSEDDPVFVDAANQDYTLQAYSAAIDNAGAGATATDRDGNTRTNPDVGAYEYINDGATGLIPTLAWTGETNFSADGVHPDSAVGGSSFEFRVDYTDSEGAAPVSIELWIDEDHDGVVETAEKHAMSAVGGGGQYGDGDYTNGERYTKSLTLTKAGGGDMTYRIVATDGEQTAIGDPANSNIVTVGNQVPTVAWPGDTNYVSDGVHPDAADSGEIFTFRVMYTDADNTAPIISQVWIDENDTMFYDSGEYFDMAAESGAGQYHDGDYANGEYFTFARAVTKAGDGRIKYRFAFSDGVDDATGDPASQQFASDRYSRVFTVNDYKTTGVSADATPASETTVNVAMVYTGDENNDNSLKVEYGVTPADTNGWTTFATATHPTSPYSPTITGLTSGESYDVKMTFTDADGVLGTVSSTDTFVMPIYAITPGTATATVATENSILVTAPYTNDGNDNSTFSVRYRVNSPQGSWVDAGSNPKDNDLSPYTIENLTYSETYDVEVTYDDPDGGGETQVITGVELPTVYTVCPDAPATCPVSSIQAAIDLATSGETVLVYAVGSPYSENILMDADDDGVTVKSDSGFGSVTIQGATSSTDQAVVRFTTGITASTILDGFTIDNQTQGLNDSTGILIDGGASPTVKNAVIAGNTVHATNSNEAGGISITRGGLTLQDSLVGSTTAGGGNSGEFSGGIYATTTSGGPYSLTISNSTIRYNTTNQNGGGIYESGFNGTFDIDDSVIANNTGASYGGGVYLYGSNLTNVDISNSTINNNSVTNESGGGIYTRVPVTISGSTITANQIGASKYGGGIYLTSAASSLEMTNSQVTNHTVGGYGLGIYSASSSNADPLDISNSTISGNSAAYSGAGVYMSYLANTAKLTNIEVSSNTANNGDGGGLYINNSVATINNITISSNSSSSDGGGAHVQGASSVVDITDSTISNNTAIGGYGGGLYAYNNADVTITTSTIASNTSRYGGGLATYYEAVTLNVSKSYIKGNHALDGGGGLWNRYAVGATTTLTSTIISGNTAGDTVSENAWGGGIYNLGRLYIYSSTIAGNYAEGGAGGIFFNGSNAETDIENSIIWSNDANANGPNYDTAILTTKNIRVNYSNIGGWDPADGTPDPDDYPNLHDQNNIDADPQFESAVLASLNTPQPGGDYRLKSASPSVDTGGGVNAAPPSDDIEGEARPYDGDGDTTATVDMGADEMTTGNQAPTLDWVGSGNYTSDGVDPDSAPSGSSFTFKVKYTDLDNHPPGTIYLWVDANNDSVFDDPGERTTLAVAGGEDGNYANGEIYETNPALTLTTVANLDYYFEASDGWLAATGSPASVRTVQVSNTVPATPTNTTPADLATNVALSSTLTGSAFVDTDPGSSHLNSQWQIDDDSGFGSVDYDTGTVGDLESHAVGTPLNVSTTYYWRVRYRDNLSAWSSYSSGTSFTTTSAPNTPTNSSPADTTTGVTITPTLTGSAYSDPNSDAHQSSQWQVDDNSDFSSVTYDSGVVSDLTSHTLGSALGEGVVYYWRVRYLDAKGAWSGYSTGTAFTTNQKPNAPSNSTPADVATDISITPTLTGSAFSDPDGGDTHAASQWQVDDNSDFSSITYDSGSSGDLTSHTLGSSLSGVTTYYWRVRYQDNNGDWSDYSTSTSFTTQSNPPTKPTNVTPANAATGVEVTPTLTGSTFADVDPGDTHASSQWQVDDNSDFSSITYDSGEVSDLESRIVELPLAGTTTYYWRVRYKDSNANWSDYSTGTSFTTEASPHYVCSGETAPYDKIQTTIADAGTLTGDKIIVCAGSYAERIDFLGKDITVKAITGAANTTITGSNLNDEAVNFSGGETTSAVLDGFTINNSYHSGSLSRGVYISGSEPSIKNTIIEDTVMISYGDGAAFYINGGGAAISNTTIRNNTARYGAGMYVTGAVNLSISNSTIEDNSSTSIGTVRLNNISGTVDITNSSISSNSALYAGGIYLVTANNTDTVDFTMTDTSIDNNLQTNVASYDGGGLYVDSGGTVTVQNITMTVTGGSISGNNSRSGGGARIRDGVDLTITGTTINNNSADTSGAGLYVNGTLTTLNMSKCTVAGNDADSYGGGIYTTVTTNITNCMITGNHVYDPGVTYSYGGGVYATSTLNVYNSTVVGNYAGYGGGGLRYGSGVVRNSIVWGNTTPQYYANIYGSPTVSYSNVGDSQHTYEGSNGNINEPPIMVNRVSASQTSPTDQGDFRLCRGLEDPVAGCTTSNTSPSIDTGTYDAAWTPSVDYDDQSRPYDVGGIDDGTNDYDMGADEYHP